MPAPEVLSILKRCRRRHGPAPDSHLRRRAYADIRAKAAPTGRGSRARSRDRSCAGTIECSSVQRCVRERFLLQPLSLRRRQELSYPTTPRSSTSPWTRRMPTSGFADTLDPRSISLEHRIAVRHRCLRSRSRKKNAVFVGPSGGSGRSRRSSHHQRHSSFIDNVGCELWCTRQRRAARPDRCIDANNRREDWKTPYCGRSRSNALACREVSRSIPRHARVGFTRRRRVRAEWRGQSLAWSQASSAGGALSHFHHVVPQPTTGYRYESRRRRAPFLQSALPGFDATAFETMQVLSRQGRNARAEFPSS